MPDEAQKPSRSESLLLAIATLLAATIDSDGLEGKLAALGLDYQDIGLIVGKKPDAVRMKLRRAAEKNA